MKITRAILEPRHIALIYLELKQFHPRFALLWELGIDSGFRISDLLNIRARDVVPVLCITEQKTGKYRAIKITEAVLNDLQFFIDDFQLAPGEFLFFRRLNRRDVPMSRQWAHRVIALASNKIGLISIGAHSMRKIYACNVYKRTRSIKSVQEALNHSKPETTLIYLRDLLT